MSESEVQLHREDGIAILTLSRPEAGNALTAELLAECGAALDRVEGARALVITGAGRTFSVGADLALFVEGLKGDRLAVLEPILDGVHDVIRRLRTVAMPVIAAVNGAAAGAGMAIALAADLRIVSRSTRFVPAYLQLGCSPDGGMTHALTRALGGARTMSLLLRGRSLDAEEILAAGLAEFIVEDGTAHDAGLEMARELSRLPTCAVLATRQLVDDSPTRSITEQLDAEAAAVSALWHTDDFAEGVNAFLEKREPQFKGR